MKEGNERSGQARIIFSIRHHISNALVPPVVPSRRFGFLLLLGHQNNSSLALLIPLDNGRLMGGTFNCQLEQGCS